MYNRLLQHKIRTAMVYADTKTLSPSTTADYHVFRLNSINDPQYALGGHQPAFHDKWSTLYGHYKVVRTSWAITFAPIRAHNYVQVASGGTATGETHGVSDSSHHNQLHLPGIVAWEFSDDTTPKQIQAQDRNVIREASGQKKNVRYALTSADPKRTYTLTGSASPSQYLDNTEMDRSCPFFQEPQNIGYLHVGALSKDGNAMAQYRYDIRLTYVVEMTDPSSVEEEN